MPVIPALGRQKDSKVKASGDTKRAPVKKKFQILDLGILNLDKTPLVFPRALERACARKRPKISLDSGESQTETTLFNGFISKSTPLPKSSKSQ
jgi:hypothetical protein